MGHNILLVDAWRHFPPCPYCEEEEEEEGFLVRVRYAFAGCGRARGWEEWIEPATEDEELPAKPLELFRWALGKSPDADAIFERLLKLAADPDFPLILLINGVEVSDEVRDWCVYFVGERLSLGWRPGQDSLFDWDIGQFAATDPRAPDCVAGGQGM